MLQALADHVLEDYLISADSRRRISGLLGQALDMLNGSRVPAALLHSGDTFGPRVRAELSALLTGAGVGDLLLHCSALDKPAPTGKWLKTTSQLLDATPTGPSVAEAILKLFVAHNSELHDDTDRLLCGLVWTIVGDGADQTTELLAAVMQAAGSAPQQAKGSSIACPTSPRSKRAPSGIRCGAYPKHPEHYLACWAYAQRLRRTAATHRICRSPLRSKLMA